MISCRVREAWVITFLKWLLCNTWIHYHHTHTRYSVLERSWEFQSAWDQSTLLKGSLMGSACSLIQGSGPVPSTQDGSANIGALIIRRGFRGPLYHIYNIIRSPQNSIGNSLGPYIGRADYHWPDLAGHLGGTLVSSRPCKKRASGPVSEQY